MSAPKKLAFYLRVSREQQEFRSQLHAMKEFCRRAGWHVPGRELFFSEKISGVAAKRRQLDRLLQACRDGHIDTVLVYRVDRLGRSALIIHNLLEQFEHLKIRVIGAADSYDSSVQNSTTVTIRNILIGLAEPERLRIRERTHAGLAAARARGRVGGRPRTKDAAIKKALALRKADPEGKKISLRGIARTVGLDPGYLSQLFSGKRPARK